MKDTKSIIAGYNPPKFKQKPPPPAKPPEVSSNPIKVCVCTECSCNKDKGTTK